MNTKYRKYIFIISVLFHIVLFLLLSLFSDYGLFSIPEEIKPEPAPLVFEFTEPKVKAREVVKTLNKSKTAPKKADLLSDSNSVAQDMSDKKSKDQSSPFQRGLLRTHELRTAKRADKTQKAQKEIKKKQEKRKFKPEDFTIPDNNKKTYKEIQKAKEASVKAKNEILHNSRLSDALEKGGLAFNTYNWDFAPYLLELKSRIQSNIFPPLAFTQLGMISGETVVRFRIYPDGSMRMMHVLGHRGHISLKDTSTNALRSSSPFPVLPENFPEPFLEVTGKFMYVVFKKNIKEK